MAKDYISRHQFINKLIRNNFIVNDPEVFYNDFMTVFGGVLPYGHFLLLDDDDIDFYDRTNELISLMRIIDEIKSMQLTMDTIYDGITYDRVMGYLYSNATDIILDFTKFAIAP